MPAAIKAAQTTHTPEALRALARSGKDATQNARLLMVAFVLEGVGRAEAGRMGGMDRQAVRDWLHRYDAEGPEGLRIVRAGGGVFSRRRAVGGCAGLDGVGSGCGARRRGSAARSRYSPEDRGGLRSGASGRERSPAAPEGGVSLRFGTPGAPAGLCGGRAAFRSGFRSFVTARVRSTFGAGGTSRPVEVWFSGRDPGRSKGYDVPPVDESRRVRAFRGSDAVEVVRAQGARVDLAAGDGVAVRDRAHPMPGRGRRFRHGPYPVAGANEAGRAGRESAKRGAR